MTLDWQAKFAEQTELLLQTHTRIELLELVVWPPGGADMPMMTAFKSTPLTDSQIEHIEARISSSGWDKFSLGDEGRITDLRGDWIVEEALFAAARFLTERLVSGSGSDEFLAEFLLYLKHFNPELKRLTVKSARPTEGVVTAESSGVELEYWDNGG